MAKVEKLNLTTFKKKLKDSGYSAAGGARRAVGKFKDWTEEERNKARKAIDRYFDSDVPAAVASPKKTKKKSKKKTAKKVAAKDAKSTGPLARHHARKKAAKEKRSKGISPEDIFESNPLAAINVTNQVVGTVDDALKTYRFAKEIHPDLDISKGVQAAYDAVATAVQGVNRQTEELLGSTDKGTNGSSKATRAILTKTGPATPPPLPSSPATSSESA